MATEKTIVTKGDYGRHEELVAAATISPGMALSRTSANKFTPDAAAQAAALKKTLCIAKEDGLQGKTVDDDYAADDQVFAYYPIPGDEVLALVKSGENIAIGDNLVTEGGGTGLFVEAAGTETKFQLESVEDTGGALAANTLVKCVVVGP